MELWAGNIRIGEDGPQDGLRDVHIYDQYPSSHISFDPGVSFSFLSFVDNASMPLHAFVGPLLNVYSEAASTEAWLSDSLLKDVCGVGDNTRSSGGDMGPWWSRGCEQSDLGILLKVDGEINASEFGSKITEILLYAIRPELPFHTRDGPPTPPRSSSPNGNSEPHSTSVPRGVQTARLVARLISSNLCYAVSQESMSLNEPPSGYAQFLTPPPDINFTQQHLVEKRQRLVSLFDDASRQNKKARRRGGESVAKAMATVDVASSVLQETILGSNSIDREPTGFPPVRVQPPERPHQLSRSHSLGSINDLNAARPGSRAGIVAARKRSSLHRVTSLVALDSSSPAPESNQMDQQNKLALTRVVMAGMRLYGFQPRQKVSHSRIASESLTCSATALVEDKHPGDEQEYKLVYHQTFKAASFVFRHQLAVMAISQDLMRDTVDRLLALFCNDQVRTTISAMNTEQTFGTEDGTEQRVFDSPSFKVFPDQATGCFGAPKKARKG